MIKVGSKKFYNHIREWRVPTNELENKEDEWSQDMVDYLLDNR